jgi:hypothetical protein
VPETWVLRKVLETKRDDFTRVWRTFYNEELDKFYSSTSIIRLTKSRRKGWQRL